MEKFAIWDLDGTLLDSLDMWYTLARRYLTGMGIRKIEENLEEIVDAMSLEEAAGYLKEQYNLPYGPEEIREQFMMLVRHLYREELPFFPKTRQKVLDLHEKGCRMCLLTTTDKICAEAALERGGIRHCFEMVCTCGELHMHKRDVKIYQKVCEIMKFEPNQTMIYEDADYALKAAAESGCMVTDAVAWRNSLADS